MSLLWLINPVLETEINFRLLFGVNEKLLTQHISGPVTKYKLSYVSNKGVGQGARVRARAKG